MLSVGFFLLSSTHHVSQWTGCPDRIGGSAATLEHNNKSSLTAPLVSVLQIHDLHGLSYITQDNPHGRFFAPMRLYLNWDLAGRAIDIHGAVGEDVELRSQRAEQAARRKATAHRIRAEQARRAAAFTPTDAVGRLCQAVGVHPDATLTKTRTMEVFRLNSRQLGIMNVPFERATNPVHARFARMQLYRAADVARACIRHGIGVSLPARNEAVTARRELEQRRMWASVLAAAMGMDRE